MPVRKSRQVFIHNSIAGARISGNVTLMIARATTAYRRFCQESAVRIALLKRTGKFRLCSESYKLHLIWKRQGWYGACGM